MFSLLHRSNITPESFEKLYTIQVVEDLTFNVVLHRLCAIACSFFTEAHILEDVNKCIEALQHGDPETLDRTAGAVRGRVARVDNVVLAEMDNYEPGPYTETVQRAIHIMRESSKLSSVSVFEKLSP